MFSYPLAVAGVSTRILQAGTEGRPVVLIHGTGGRADRWQRNLDPVAAAGYRVFAIDLPGHGFAAKSGEHDHSVPGYARFVADYLEEQGLEDVTLVGTSLGGHVAATVALQHPERVHSLVLVGSMGLAPLGDEARMKIAKGASNQTREGVAMKLRRVIADAELVTPLFEEEEFRVNNSPGAQASFDALGAYIGARGDVDLVGDRVVELAGRKPVLLVWGDRDLTVSPQIGRQVRDTLPSSQLVLIEGAAHTAYYEKPDVFNPALVAFLRDGKAPASVAGAQII